MNQSKLDRSCSQWKKTTENLPQKDSIVIACFKDQFEKGLNLELIRRNLAVTLGDQNILMGQGRTLRSNPGR